MYLSYFGIRVTDLDRSLKFYKDLLGLQEVARGDGSKSGAGTYVLLRDRKSGLKLELNWYPKSSKYATPYSPGEGLDHIAFCVDSVEKKLKELEGKGVEKADFTPGGGETYRYVKDPDGNWIELYQRKKTGKKIPRGY